MENRVCSPCILGSHSTKYDIHVFRDSERNKAATLLLKISEKIMNNPSMTAKYGNLNSSKIHNKLSKCKPALDLLFIVGFKRSNDNARLIWTKTKSNFELIANLNDSLKSMQGRKMITNNNMNIELHENFTTSLQNTLIQSGYTNDEVTSVAFDTNWMKEWKNPKCKCTKPLQMDQPIS